MALQDRIHSLETEYAVNYLANMRRRAPGSGTLVDMIKRVLAESHGLHSTEFLVNGSKLYHDVGHAEWALPECRSAYEATVYDKAADHLFMHHAIPRADRDFTREGHDGRLVVTKNNADPYGHTYGCHENYQMQRDADLLGDRDFLRYLARNLIPFLVTRQILVGAGLLVVDRHPTPHQSQVHYEFAQRSSFIQTVVSRDTTKHRPIFNLGREGESFAAGNSRRLHQILGDANLSGWATYLKLGSTGLMLRLIEDLYIDAAPALKDPVEALRAISADLAGTATVELQNGQRLTALDIQWLYYDLADSYLNMFGATDDDEVLMETWGKALEDFEHDPANLRNRADWAIKKQMLDAFLQQHDWSFDTIPVHDQNVITELQALDLRYHELSSDGLYHRLYPVDTLITQAEIAHACENPPPYTRARIRGESIRLGRECDIHINAASWTEISIEGERVRLLDPLACDHPVLVRWEHPWEQLKKQLEHNPGDKWLHFKLGKSYEQAGRYYDAQAAFQHAVNQDARIAVLLDALARAHLRIGEYQIAKKWYETHNQLVTRSMQDGRENLIGLGDAHRHSGDLDKALQVYRKATRVGDPEPAHAYARMALVHLLRNEIQSAETYFRKALDICSEQLLAQVGLGAILLGRNERDSAIEAFKNALALSDYQVHRMLTPQTACYLRAVAQLGLNLPTALETLDSALADQSTAAADGISLLKPLLDLLARGAPPPDDLVAARARIQDMHLQPAPPSSSKPTPAQTRTLRWARSALQQPSTAVRMMAVAALEQRLDGGHFNDDNEFVPLLIDTAQHDSDPRVRRIALQALARPELHDSPLLDGVRACVHDENCTVRWAAQTTLKQIALPGRPAPTSPANSNTSAIKPTPHEDPLRWLEELATRHAERHARRNRATDTTNALHDDLEF